MSLSVQLPGKDRYDGIANSLGSYFKLRNGGVGKTNKPPTINGVGTPKLIRTWGRGHKLRNARIWKWWFWHAVR